MRKILIIIVLFLVCFEINASIVVMDADSGRILYEKDKDKKMLIASTTKIMTSVVALENESLNKQITIKDEIDKMYGSMTYIKKGEKFTLNDLLHGLMLRSGNDTAMSIASNVKDYDTFIKLMNLKAYSLDMKNTQFNNPHGLDEETQNISTAYDMSLLMRYAIKNKNFINITSTRKYKTGSYIWHNKNDLLSMYKYTTSGKIGYTTKSGPVFVSSATKENKTIVITSIKENDKFDLHKNLYIKYFNEYKRYQILDKNTISYKLKKEKNTHYYIKNDFYMLLKPNEIKNVNIKIDINNLLIHIYLKEELIHSERIYKIEYDTKSTKFNKILSFFKK